ncbi:C4-dicarboxylate ABC transporter [Yersinia ruckeri]|uniref:TDT family transporter n=1 Tax=Yersinia ruckeri TaxID=29486 RepID=UPI0004E45718|nr:TDT family transporter [Yersinia ruckeri]ARZ02781.1 Tellurite resistance protein TehA [Yersinia ruckeri]KFE37830.1 C4-dicarboxylate ABC transporter [Yersinia ruckeri]OIX39580.1 C4-dicarboxylate ABC transporter [Yersinia ruckeri]OIX39694.1 C4-dicarboxylate ABC transporter [Yersinia ruckeri]OIX39919.1 C4-dicarboxylate ABC transporter [Yersinia ruckeri]
MLRIIHRKIRGLPTPIAGLALGISSIGWCLENTLPLHGMGQNIGALIAAVLLFAVASKFVLHFGTLLSDLKHPVVGSVVPTFTMGCMVVSKALGNFSVFSGEILWSLAVIIHLIFLAAFIYHRLQEIEMHHMVPSWFVPPVGIIVASVAVPNQAFMGIAYILLMIGMLSYACMLPMMIYRFMFCREVPDAAKPTIAIMAAPASLSLAGYLTVVPNPSLLVCALLFGIAILMTAVIYMAFFRLLKLPFSPGYAAFTFPMAIGATALYKLANLVGQYELARDYSYQLHCLATFEAAVATLIIFYVAVRYVFNYSVFNWSLRVTSE